MAGKKGSILIVEDDPKMTVLMRTALNEAGFRVETVQDPRAILRKELLVKPDLLLIDFMKPDLSEEDFRRSLCDYCREHRIRIIAVSSLERPGDVEDALQAGADDYLVKPVRLGELVLRVKKQMESNHSSVRVFRKRGPVLKQADGGAPPGKESDEIRLPDLEDGEVDLPREIPRTQRVRGKILVIDDDRDHLEVVESFLTARGHRVLLADNGPDGITLAEREEPDLILLDVRMPRMDGYTVSRELADRPTTGHIPIILVTVIDGSAEVVQGLSGYADDYVTKPYNVDELIARLESVLRRTLRTGRSKRDRMRLIRRVVDRARRRQYDVFSPHLEDLKDCPLRWKGPLPDVIAVRGKQCIAYLVETLHTLNDERTLDRWEALEMQPDLDLQVVLASKEAMDLASLFCREYDFRARLRLYHGSRKEQRRQTNPLVKKLLGPFST